MTALSIDARKTLTTMAAELSAEFATFDPDEVMLEWVRARNSAPFEPVYPDRDANYAAVRKVDLSELEPLVAFPDSVIENSHPVAAAAGTRSIRRSSVRARTARSTICSLRRACSRAGAWRRACASS